MEVVLSRKAAKTLEGLDKSMQTRIVSGIYRRPAGDIKPMQGYSDGRQRLRVGKYRVVFRYTTQSETKGLYIMEIGSRGDIYK